MDFDSTIVNSSETILKMYEKKKGVKLNYNLSKLLWNFEPYILKDDFKWAVSQFSQQEFYDNLELIPDCYKILEELSKDYEIIICTKKEPVAVPMNDKWIKDKLPFIKRVVYLSQDDFNKSYVSGDIIINDNADCLIGGNRELRILFGNYGYQVDKNIDGITRCENWYQIYELLKQK